MTDSQQETADHETSYETKRVFLRGEHKDEIEVWPPGASKEKDTPIDRAVIVKRELTYFGPKLRIESNESGEQYLLTVPGPQSHAQVWKIEDNSWKKDRYAALDFGETIPQYEFCPHCNEPLSTVKHRRRAAIGACVTNE